LTESIIRRCPHISLDLYLSDDIARILTDLISISLLYDGICWLFESPDHEERPDDPDDESDDEDEKEDFHRVMIDL
jgi:regulator of RNase E activity RraB